MGSANALRTQEVYDELASHTGCTKSGEDLQIPLLPSHSRYVHVTQILKGAIHVLPATPVIRTECGEGKGSTCIALSHACTTAQISSGMALGSYLGVSLTMTGFL